MNGFELAPGDTIRVIAPSFSLAIISPEVRAVAQSRFKELGLNITFGEHVEEIDSHASSSINSRISDLHNAFHDPTVKAIFAVIGGHNSNQLLSHLDWNLIRANPKPLIGYSDTTALQNALLAKANIVSYSGPAFSTFGQKKYFEYTLEYFKKAVMTGKPYDVIPSKIWTDDEWFIDQENRSATENMGWLPINPGEARGRIVGGNLGTLSSLFGTEYMPNIDGSVLFLEDDAAEKFKEFDRLLQSLIHQPGFMNVQGIVLGRFQVASGMTSDFIKELFDARPDLRAIPVIANVDFGHTSPIITYPIGGIARISVNNSHSSITIEG